MSFYKPNTDERELLKKSVAKFSHDPIKSQLLALLEVAESEYAHGGEEWNKLKFCAEQYFLHAQTEVRRDPNKKSAKVALGTADALARKFHPNFS